MRYDNKCSALPYFKKWLQTHTHTEYSIRKRPPFNNGSLENIRQSKPSTEDYEQCKGHVKDCYKQLKQCSTRDHNQMNSSQTNLGIFAMGVENNSNGSGECNCGFWGVLEVLVCIAIAIFVLFLVIRCFMSYIARRWVRRRSNIRKNGWKKG